DFNFAASLLLSSGCRIDDGGVMRTCLCATFLPLWGCFIWLLFLVIGFLVPRFSDHSPGLLRSAGFELASNVTRPFNIGSCWFLDSFCVDSKDIHQL
ncbi:hypothetical protein A2U01_0023487, partial [Trifolium medium]|nr:hypothetical protein [Trifolium medium]